MSNRERIARAAEEARLTEVERTAKKEAKATKVGRSRPAPKAVRMKIVWEVCSSTGAVVKTFSYPEKAAAESAIEALTKSTGRTHLLRATKVPME
jgi:hypothetical protein